MSDVKVFKFGGASVSTADGFKNVARIIETYADQKLIVVISAIGKTTNALEKLLQEYVAKRNNTKKLLDEIRQSHIDIIESLAISHSGVLEDIHDTMVEVEWILDEEPNQDYDYLYDQIVSLGEMLSSKILFYYLHQHIPNIQWLDVRDVIITDSTFRDARVQWDITAHNAKQKLPALFDKTNVIITQGFIGSTQQNETTTLGREGSDYTAAILSYCIDAQSIHIWKDVPGVLTGDPKLFDEVAKLPRLSYREAIEMTYYGAKVIHPKTIKPLQNKQIPLYVRPFQDMHSEGTLISDVQEVVYPPIIVIEPNQCLIHISTKDFSFVAEHHLSKIFSLLSKHRLKVNMMRNTAISFTVCVNQVLDRIEKFHADINGEFKTLRDDDLELITIRHYTPDILKDMKRNKLILFEERLSDTVQMVTKSLPSMKLKA